MRIVGTGWAGNARQGFQFNPVPIGPPSSPATACDHTGTQLTITFSGISFSCGCVQTDASHSVIATDIAMNAAFVLPRVSTGPPVDAWQAAFPSIFAASIFPNTTCINPPDSSDLAGIQITVVCQSSGYFVEATSISLPITLDIFEATNFIGNPASIPNSVTCGSTITGVGVVTGGTASITIP